MATADLIDRQQAAAQAEELLAQLERGRQSAAAPHEAGEAPQGSPFLEGQTVTVAGAALLQRVAAAVTRVGGNVLSSQVDVKEAQQKAGLISMVASLRDRAAGPAEAPVRYRSRDALSVRRSAQRVRRPTR